MARFEVQTRFFIGWENCWSEDEKPMTFATEQEAEDAICEFFADLGAAGIQFKDLYLGLIFL